MPPRSSCRHTKVDIGPLKFGLELKKVVLSVILAETMARNTSKMTLYEVTNKVAKVNESRTRRGGNTPPKATEPRKIEKKPDMSMRVKATRTQKRPLLASYKRRRSLLTRPYVVIALALGFIWLVWMVTRVPNEPENPVDTQNEAVETKNLVVPVKPFLNKEVVADPVMNVTEAPPTVVSGDHVIVLATYISMDELKQVKAYFAENGVETVIEENRKYYVLVTKDRYNNPNNRDTDGYAAKQRLKQIGAKYKAPPGFKGFTFNDIYGKKVN